MRHRLWWLLLPALALTTARCMTQTGGDRMTDEPRYILAGGTVLAGPDLTPIRDGAVLVHNGRIAGVGRLEEIRRRNARLPILDAKEATILPGLIDAHAHLDNLGKQLDIVKLTGTGSYQEVIDKVKQQAAILPAGAWVLGRGWDQNDWAVQEFPTAAAMDQAVPHHPVWIDRIDGHASLANSAAMKIAGITAATPDLPGGRIVRDGSGQPTGIFIDNAREIIRALIPRPSREVQKSRLLRAARLVASLGLTAIHHTGTNDSNMTDDELVEILQELIAEDALPIRVYVMLSEEPGLLSRWYVRGPLHVGDHLTVRGVKVYADGALGSRGAALLEPYSDDPGNSGLLTVSRERLRQIVREGRKFGFQVGVHAIGDRGVREVLDAFEEEGVQPEDRFRIEHLQVIALEDIPCLRARGIIGSMQPTHATSDMEWAERRLGPRRIAGAYAWRKLLDAGVRLPFGSDFPVEEVNPFLGIYAAVTRQDIKGNPEGGWLAHERVTLAEAIKGFTSEAAFAAFEERKLGTIEDGKLADFTIVEGDLLSLDPARLFDVRVRYTIVGGKIVHDARK